MDGRCAVKHGKRYFGYKNYSGIDAEHKASRRPRRMCMTARRLTTDDLIDPDPTDPGVWVDRAYRNQETEKAPQDAGYESHICETVQRDRPPT